MFLYVVRVKIMIKAKKYMIISNDRVIYAFSQIELYEIEAIPNLWMRFFLAYFSGINIAWNIYDFIIISIIMGFIGSILSGSKLISAIVGGLVAPLTIIQTRLFVTAWRIRRLIFTTAQ